MISRPFALAAALLASVTLTPRASEAQPRSGRGFMFGAPSSSVTFRGGYAMPSEGSDLFSFVQKNLTLSHGDFAGASLGADLSFFVNPRTAVQLGFGYSGRLASSVFRNWVDNNDREIEQSSELRRLPLSIGVRYYLRDLGRSVSQYVWVPARVTPYVSAGGGFTWYQFRQTGDFVDFKTLDVFGSTFVSSSWTPSAYAAAGAEYALSARTSLVGEMRYDMARARLSNDFSGFNRIDVSGAAFAAGLTVRF